MLRVKVICIGRLKEPYLRDACAEYQKRLSSFCRLEVEELAPARVPEAASDAQIAAALAQEGERILAQIPSSAYVYAMCIEGKQRGSEQFSAELTRLTVEGVSSVCFLIGGSWGLSEAAKARAQAKLSMSQMTFPHQLDGRPCFVTPLRLVIKNSRRFSAIASCAYLLDPRDDGRPCFVIRAARNKKGP